MGHSEATGAGYVNFEAQDFKSQPVGFAAGVDVCVQNAAQGSNLNAGGDMGFTASASAGKGQDAGKSTTNTSTQNHWCELL
jgi:hypothetical protein